MAGAQRQQTPPELAAGFRASWERLGAPSRVLLAVSGGADSTALMRLAARLARERLAHVSVATVDHGLRSVSRREAETVGDAARSLGLDHAILFWTGDKPASGVQAAARRARYRLLVRHAFQIGAEAIMTAHTADDQAETVFMRLAHGSGPRGLAGMAEKSLIAADASAPIPLLRPLLDRRREALRAYLESEGVSWFEDPANENDAFERVRTRRLIAEMEREGTFSAGALTETAHLMQAAARRIEQSEDARFIALRGAFDAFGGASLDAAALSASDAPLIARLIASVAGADYAPNDAASQAALGAALAGKPATLGGAMLSLDRDRLEIARELAAIFGRTDVAPLDGATLRPGEALLWDGRFIVFNGAPDLVIVRPLSEREANRLSLDRRAAGAPALWTGGAPAALPGESAWLRPLAAEKFHLGVNRFH